MWLITSRYSGCWSRRGKSRVHHRRNARRVRLDRRFFPSKQNLDAGRLEGRYALHWRLGRSRLGFAIDVAEKSLDDSENQFGVGE